MGSTVFLRLWVVCCMVVTADTSVLCCYTVSNCWPVHYMVVAADTSVLCCYTVSNCWPVHYMVVAADNSVLCCYTVSNCWPVHYMVGLIVRKFKYYKETRRRGGFCITVKRSKTHWICHVTSICLLKRVTEGERKTWRWRRSKQQLDDFGENGKILEIESGSTGSYCL
jgi:hypothetical protein